MRFPTFTVLGQRLSQSAEFGRAITREAGALVLTCQLYPFGIAGNSLPVLPGRASHPTRGAVPVLFIHGVLQNPAAFTWLKQRLAWEGWKHLDEINLLTTIRSIPENARLVARRVEKLKERHGVSQVDLVAHSMGGIIARYFVQVLGGEKYVRRLITLGTPHGGTDWSRLSVFPSLRELGQGSKTLDEIREKGAPRRTRAISVSGGADIFDLPRGCHLWPGVKNIQLSGLGHAGLLFSNRVAQILLDHLG